MARRTFLLWLFLFTITAIVAVTMLLRPGRIFFGQAANDCGDGIIDRTEQCEIGYPCPSDYRCGQACRCVFMGGSSSVAVQCGDGYIDPGEQCEIGYPCPSGMTCTSTCGCVANSSSTSSVSSRSSSSATSSTSSTSSSSLTSFSSSISSSLSSSAPASSAFPPSSSCTRFDCTPPARCWFEDPVVDNRGCPVSCGTLHCLYFSSSSAPHQYPPRCGNGILEAGEQCETFDLCPEQGTCSRCRCTPQTPAWCGNGVLDPGEECERSVPCQGEAICTVLTCRCRPGSSRSSSTQFAVSVGSSASAQADVVCGNGRLDAGEQCDMNLPCPGDGFCNTSCFCISPPIPAPGPGTPVAPYAAPAPPASSASLLCGNGRFDRGEQCEVNLPCPYGGSCTAGCTCAEPGSPSSSPLASLSPDFPLAFVPSSAAVDAQSYVSPPLPFAPIPPSLQTLPAAAIELPLAPARMASSAAEQGAASQGNAVTSIPAAPRPAAPPITTQTGPATLLIVIAGGAAGWAWRRRKK